MSAHPKCFKPASNGNPWGLTQAQCDVIECIFECVSWKAMARHLGVPETTVASRLDDIFRKMGVRSKVQAAVLWDRYEREAAQQPKEPVCQ